MPTSARVRTGGSHRLWSRAIPDDQGSLADGYSSEVENVSARRVVVRLLDRLWPSRDQRDGTRCAPGGSSAVVLRSSGADVASDRGIGSRRNEPGPTAYRQCRTSAPEVQSMVYRGRGRVIGEDRGRVHQLRASTRQVISSTELAAVLFRDVWPAETGIPISRSDKWDMPATAWTFVVIPRYVRHVRFVAQRSGRPTEPEAGAAGEPKGSAVPEHEPGRRLVEHSSRGRNRHVTTRTVRRWIADGRLTGYRSAVVCFRLDLDELDASFQPLAAVPRDALKTTVGGPRQGRTRPHATGSGRHPESQRPSPSTRHPDLI